MPLGRNTAFKWGRAQGGAAPILLDAAPYASTTGVARRCGCLRRRAKLRSVGDDWTLRNEAAVLIRKEIRAIGARLMETALARERAKGCSPVLCVKPVALEPPYTRFDTDHVLTLPHPSRRSPRLRTGRSG